MANFSDYGSLTQAAILPFSQPTNNNCAIPSISETSSSSNSSLSYIALGTILSFLLLSPILLSSSTTTTLTSSPPPNNPNPILGGTYSAALSPLSLFPPSTVSYDHKNEVYVTTPLLVISRPEESSPSEKLFPWIKGKGRTLPTNSWYQNMLIGTTPSTTEANKIYTIPYVVDTMFGIINQTSSPSTTPTSSFGAGAAAGLRIHAVNIAAPGEKIVQVEYDVSAAVGLGALSCALCGFDIAAEYNVKDGEIGALGLGIEWRKVSRGNRTTFDGDSADSAAMHSPIIRGSPYMTMHYNPGVIPVVSSTFFPYDSDTTTGGSYIYIDGNDDEGFKGERLDCSTLNNSAVTVKKGEESSNKSSKYSVLARKQVTLHFSNSDMTWQVYISRPTNLSCRVSQSKDSASFVPPPSIPGVLPEPPGINFELFSSSSIDFPLTFRLALTNNCTTGSNPTHCVRGAKPRDSTAITRLLSKHSDLCPTVIGSKVEYTFPTMAGYDVACDGDVKMHFRWGVESMSERDKPPVPGDNNNNNNIEGVSNDNDEEIVEAIGTPKTELLMYALPHHVDILEGTVGSTNGLAGHCSPSLHGSACLVLGDNWIMSETLPKNISFTASRPPGPLFIPSLALALKRDINYKIPANYMKGAGDTYFSGKMLAKLARILVVSQEVIDLALLIDDVHDMNMNMDEEKANIVKACHASAANLPNEEEMKNALSRLRDGVTVWLNGKSQALFVYDEKWGGIVNCGCDYDSETHDCNNVFPTCPGVLDAGSNFGHGFYNDHHFHQGYHIYAAATLSSFDAAWGRAYFHPVLSLIRDIANPSHNDKYFPIFRHKDWYLGNSWASGIGLIAGGPYPNGRNQESSSEAIAAYEAVALYGDVMYKAWGSSDSSEEDNSEATTAAIVRDTGRLLLATELRSAQRYWHVKKSSHGRIYPKEYTPGVVGMLWSLMAQFQTWFGSAPFLAYGIQLIPITPISERRDEIEWAKEVYPEFNASCAEQFDVCEDQGWSILVRGMQATVGEREEALKQMLEIPEEAFVSAGGNGHSLSNSIWWISTRPFTEKVVIPVDSRSSEDASGSGGEGGSEDEFHCRACTHEECISLAANGCPSGAPFLCLQGTSVGGCSQVPWAVSEEGWCLDCCELYAGC